MGVEPTLSCDVIRCTKFLIVFFVVFVNRYPPREYPTFKAEPPQQHMNPPAPVRRFDDIAPPGVEEPPVPGLEPPTFDDR